jgi:phosphoribosylformylglycinamidine cyclo-ligase
VLDPDRYVLSASIVGVVEREKILGRSSVRPGDALVALASSGPHTNGFTLLRRLMARDPRLARRKVGRRTFLDAILAPHVCYYRPLKPLIDQGRVHGLAHVTGGGISDNLERILPPHLDARVDVSRLVIPPVFSAIREEGRVTDAEMAHVFNLGAGMIAAVPPRAVPAVVTHLRRAKVVAYPIGEVGPGRGRVRLEGSYRWS